MLFHHIKFFSYYIIAALGMFAIFTGGNWIVLGYVALVGFFIVGDLTFGDDLSTPDYPYKKLLTFALWLALPVSIAIVLSGALLVAAPDSVLGSFAQPLTWWQWIAAALFCGLMLGGVGTISAHELVHRVGDKISVLIGRWILALSFDSSFSIEHVYGHHRYVATHTDPATAPRGRNVYAHILISTLKGNMSAWNIEAKNMTRRKLSVWSWHNKCLRGYAMSAVWLLCIFLLAGQAAMLFALTVGLVAKANLEIVNYMEHYGIVRDPKNRVMPKHSWNTNRRLSCWAMFNLCRHSHHHAQGAVPFERLKPMPEAPTMIGGYLATMMLTLVPPLWYKLMQPKLAHWDSHYASEAELAIIAEQASGRSSAYGIERANTVGINSKTSLR